jgi:peptidyl-prolyl cis-trans isomerase C
VSRPFEDQQGWHIVKIDQLRKRRPPSLEDLRDTIERYLKSQQLEKILKQLRGQAEIVKRNPARSSSMDKPAARTAPALERVVEAPASALAPDPASALTETHNAPAPVLPDATPPASAPKPATTTPAATTPAKPAPATPTP